MLFAGAMVPGVGLIFLGIGSFLGHQYGGKWWAMDWVGMYVAFAAIICHNLELSWLWLVPIAGFAYKWGADKYIATALLWLGAVASAYYAGLPVLAPIIGFAIAFGCQRLAETSSHESLRYQAFHSLWHLVTATAMVFVVA